MFTAPRHRQWIVLHIKSASVVIVAGPSERAGGLLLLHHLHWIHQVSQFEEKQTARRREINNRALESHHTMTLLLFFKQNDSTILSAGGKTLQGKSSNNFDGLHLRTKGVTKPSFCPSYMVNLLSYDTLKKGWYEKKTLQFVPSDNDKVLWENWSHCTFV